MEYDLLLIIFTIRALWPPGLQFPSLSIGLFPDWSCWIAAYRLAAIISALLT